MKKFLILILLMSLFIIDTKAINYHSYIVLDANSKRIIEGYNYNSRHLIASITKVMTAIIVIENLDLQTKVKADNEAITQEGSSVYLKENNEYTIEYLLYGLLLRSGNDCANLLARSCYGSVENFAYVMNEYAKMIKMTNSTFENPSGLDSVNENYSTCYDMAILMSYCIKNDTFRKISSTTSYEEFTNKHKLIMLNDIFECGKTGYTKKCGRTLITTAKKDDVELVCVTFEMPGDFQFHKNKLTEGLENYKIKKVLKKNYVKQNLITLDYLLYYEDVKIPVRKKEKLTYKVVLNKEVLIIYSDSIEILRISLKREYIKV